MSKRNTQLRRHAISNLVNEKGEVSVDELSAKFETSEVTIRKDLASLEKNGQLLRRYGGAISLPKEVVNEELGPQVSTRKISLAKAAADLIRDHNRIVIDSGSTTGALIQQLNSKRGLVVMTNSLHVANALNELGKRTNTANDRRHLGYPFGFFSRQSRRISTSSLRF